jgi:quinoprotein glucose dehydrogenase
MGTKKGDYLIAYALPRAGEKGPSFLSRTLNRPGGRFALNLTFAALGAASIIVAIVLLLRRRKR